MRNAVAAPFMQPVICPILIGRAAQLDPLGQCIDRASDGHGQTVLIAGEAGVGKSRLLAEAKAYAAERRIALLQGACFPQDSAYPYAPLLDLLRACFAGHTPAALTAAIGPFARELASLLPDLAPLPTDLPPLPALEPEHQKRRLFEALAYCLTRPSIAQPTLLIVEDLHWSDEGSLDFLLYLMRRFAAQPLLLIGTYRSDEVGPQLGRWLAQGSTAHLRGNTRDRRRACGDDRCDGSPRSVRADGARVAPAGTPANSPAR